MVLTPNASPGLAIPNGMALPADVTYLVKSEIGSVKLAQQPRNTVKNLIDYGVVITLVTS